MLWIQIPNTFKYDPDPDIWLLDQFGSGSRVRYVINFEGKILYFFTHFRETILLFGSK